MRDTRTECSLVRVFVVFFLTSCCFKLAAAVACADERKSGHCEAKRKAGLCPTWGCDKTCGTCEGSLHVIDGKPCADRRKSGRCKAKRKAGLCPTWGCDKTCGTCTDPKVDSLVLAVAQLNGAQRTELFERIDNLPIDSRPSHQVSGCSGAKPCNGYLQWTTPAAPETSDRRMGLNHQMASFSCALGEAFYLNRTLLFPDEMCFEEEHLTRWGSANARDASVLCVPLHSLFDVPLLSSYVRLHLCGRGGCNLRFPANSTIIVPRIDQENKETWSRRWTSLTLASRGPCDRFPLAVRPIRRFGFRECINGRIDSALVRHVQKRIGSFAEPFASADGGPLRSPVYEVSDEERDVTRGTNVRGSSFEPCTLSGPE